MKGVTESCGWRRNQRGALNNDSEKDFDRESRCALIIGDNYGIVCCFHNDEPRSGDPDVSVFLPAVIVANLRIRRLVDATEWNRDGWSNLSPVLATDASECF